MIGEINKLNHNKKLNYQNNNNYKQTNNNNNNNKLNDYICVIYFL